MRHKGLTLNVVKADVEVLNGTRLLLAIHYDIIH
jgi:hypothetical protein